MTRYIPYMEVPHDWIEARRRRAVIRRLRGHLAFFGVSTAGMSDEEVERHVVESMRQLGEVARRAGVTGEEAARAMAIIGRLGFGLGGEAADG